jgi:hypothetical protein
LDVDGCWYLFFAYVPVGSVGSNDTETALAFLGSNLGGVHLEPILAAVHSLVAWRLEHVDAVEEKPAADSRGETPPVAKDHADERDLIRKVPPAARKAYLSFKVAEAKLGRQLADREAYDYLNHEIEFESTGEWRELSGYQLPNFDTWIRHLRTARKTLGEQKYNKRSGRPHGGSIAESREVECPRDD